MTTPLLYDSWGYHLRATARTISTVQQLKRHTYTPVLVAPGYQDKTYGESKVAILKPFFEPRRTNLSPKGGEEQRTSLSLLEDSPNEAVINNRTLEAQDNAKGPETEAVRSRPLFDDLGGAAVHPPRRVEDVAIHVQLGLIVVVIVHGAQPTTRYKKCLRPFIFGQGGKGRKTPLQMDGIGACDRVACGLRPCREINEVSWSIRNLKPSYLHTDASFVGDGAV